MTSTREGRVYVPPTGADDAGFTPCSRSIQVGEFEVAIPGGIWVAIGVNRTPSLRIYPARLVVVADGAAVTQHDRSFEKALQLVCLITAPCRR